MIRTGVTSMLALAASSCMFSGGTRTVTALELRAAVVGLDLHTIDGNMRSAFERGEVWPGASEAQLYVARGEPRLWWNTQIGTTPCRIHVHQSANPAFADLSVTTCGGVVVSATQLEPRLPCWRLADVGPRLVKASAYFESRPLETQWQIVIGLLHRGQAEQDVVIAFGDPANRGFDEREDGRRAEQLVFLDPSGDAYGLDVTLIENKVVAWKMPAERRLTPEAEQRRLDKVEKRLEDLAIEQHAESVKLFGDVMAKQDEILKKLSRPPPAMPPPAQRDGDRVAVAGGEPSGNADHVVTGSNTLTLNDCTFTDQPSGALGQRCSMQNGHCPSAYTCESVTASTGRCVPSAQHDACYKAKGYTPR